MVLIPNDSYKIKKTKNKWKWVFALKDINPWTVLWDYLWKIVTAEEDEKLEKIHWLFWWFALWEVSIFPEDVNADWIHKVNHSCSPNSDVILYKSHNIFFSLRKIFAWEEITIPYMLNNEASFNYPCFCWSKICTWTMSCSKNSRQKKFNFLLKLAEKNNEWQWQLGECVKPLKEYPKFIRDNKIFNIFSNFNKTKFTVLDQSLFNQISLRKLIRKHWRPIYFPSLKNICVYWIKDWYLITKL